MNDSSSFIIKRDGSKVDFDPSRIQVAIEKALVATGQKTIDSLKITEKVCQDLFKLSSLPSVEKCQDLVEEELMSFGYHKTAKAYILYREERNKKRGMVIPDEWKKKAKDAVSYFDSVYNYIVYLRTYARWLEDKGRRETWPETVDRFMDCMKETVKDMLSEVEYEELRQSILHMEVMPSMRMLQFSGDAARRNNVCAYNCSYIAPTKLVHFHDTMSILMSGTGVGYSIESKYISKLPVIKKQTGDILGTHVVGDSREGWCEAFLLGLETWYDGKDIIFDYSQVRKAGARLKTTGGRASGPQPLKDLLDFSRKLILDKQESQLSTINVHDLMCKIGNIVVCGGVRRCLAKGSRVAARFGYRPIETIKVGDEVVTEKEFQKVTAVFDQGEQKVLEIRYMDEGVLKCTANHRVAVGDADEYVWVEAGKLSVGDNLVYLSRYDSLGPVILGIAPIKSIKELEGTVQTYDIEVEEDHCFFCENVLVHNSSLISISDLSDEAMRHAKDGNYWNTHPDRGMANNSAAYNKPPTDKELMEEWLSLAKSGSGERGIFNRSNLFEQLPERRIKLLGELIKDMGTNPCIAGDTWIQTVDGPMQVHELVGNPVNLTVNGKERKVLSKGFYKTGNKRVMKITTENGLGIVATPNHPFIVRDKEGRENKTELININVGDLVCLDGMEPVAVRSIESSKKPIDVYDVTVEGHEFIANGFRVGNCGEILLLPLEFCNLSSAILRADDTRDTIIRKIRLATILGTYQSMLTDFKNISPEWKKLAELERLLGVSINGQRDCRYLQENVELLDVLKETAIETNRIYAKRFGINQSAAVTAIKPEGTSSQTFNTSSGLHTRHAPFYIRRVRISATDPLAMLLIAEGVPHFPENGQTIDNVNTWVFEFPQKSPEGSICRKDLTALDQLNYWKEVKVRYTEHNPSCTISVGEDEWITCLNWLRENWNIVGGLSFLPRNDNDRVYTLSPYEEITEEEYNRRVKDMPDVDFSKLILYEKEDHTERKQQFACVGDKCEMV